MFGKSVEHDSLVDQCTLSEAVNHAVCSQVVNDPWVQILEYHVVSQQFTDMWLCPSGASMLKPAVQQKHAYESAQHGQLFTL